MSTCNICLMDYDAIGVRPVVGTCGHTLCEPCSKQINFQCPTCRKTSFLTPSVNYELLELIQSSGGDSCCHKKFNNVIKQMEKKFNDKIKEITEDCSKKLNEIEGKRRIEQGVMMEQIIVDRNATGDRFGELEDRLNVLQAQQESLADQKVKDQANQTVDEGSMRVEIKGRRKRKIDGGLPIGAIKGEVPKANGVFTVKRLKVAPGWTIECHRCGGPFPEDVVLRMDGVSAECAHEGCGHWNIVAPVREQYRWIFMDCEGGFNPHYQQIPAEDHDETNICRVCGNEGPLYEVQLWQIAKKSFIPVPSTSQQQPGTSQSIVSPWGPIFSPILGPGPIFSPNSAPQAANAGLPNA